MDDSHENILTNSLDGFWTTLEFKISGILHETQVPELKGFWCDGIYLTSTDHQLKKKFINDHRKVQLKAWLGKTGQDEYEATIFFGKKAMSSYARNLRLVDSIPSDSNDWFEIDIEKKLIEIFLK